MEMGEVLLTGLAAMAHNIEACGEEEVGAGRIFLEDWSMGHSSGMAKTLGRIAPIHPHFHECPS